jgi:hypothetical protein
MILVPLRRGDRVNDRIVNHQPIGNWGLVHGTMATTLLASYLASLIIVTFDWETMKTTLACLFALLTPAFGLAGRPKDQWMLEKPEISLQLSS